MSQIYYTLTDEAPALATASWLPIVRAFAKTADIDVSLTDISLAGRILALFPDYLSTEQQQEDGLSFLATLTQYPQANIIKLPNISASIPQLKACISELQTQGYKLPNYPEQPENEEQQAIKDRYTKVLGSAVNPVLREGNSDRRAPSAVKAYARKFPHSMGEWASTSKTHADYMRRGDFFSSEQSYTLPSADQVRIEFVNSKGEVELKKQLELEAGEIIDSMRMSCAELCEFFEASLEDAKAKDVIWSLHLKATMMKVSHPIVFGYAVKVFFKEVFNKYEQTFADLGINPNNGLAALYEKITQLPSKEQDAIKADLDTCFAKRPKLAMVDSDKGITNLHVPSDVIVDASMPAMIRIGGKMWDDKGEPQDTKAVMPESTYARIYQQVIAFCKQHGAFDPTRMGSVANVGLMAKKAEEYGSHDKTFEIEEDGIMRVVNSQGQVLMQHEVRQGDIWRACQTKDEAIKDWVKLAVNRARQSNTPAVFWLDNERAHDAELIKKINAYLTEHDTQGLELPIKNYQDAIEFSMERLLKSEDTISVTGNVLRDYLTDLFPILELGTSAKMLSIVPMIKGGSMYETGAGGSAPKHVQQLQQENHLRWDSLGEFLALGVSLEDIGIKANNTEAAILAKTLDEATTTLLENNQSPARSVGQLDNRGSHFYLALYWSQALAQQTEAPNLAQRFTQLAEQLQANEAAILDELNKNKGQAADLAGYYHPKQDLVTKVFRPSNTFNQLIDQL